MSYRRWEDVPAEDAAPEVEDVSSEDTASEVEGVSAEDTALEVEDASAEHVVSRGRRYISRGCCP